MLLLRQLILKAIEVEQAISTLDGVQEVAVFGQPSEVWGEIIVAAIAMNREVQRSITKTENLTISETKIRNSRSS